MRQTLMLAALAGAALVGSGVLEAQTVDVEVEPITCWWRASTGSVRVGEPFSVVLTCAVVETAATRVVPDQSRLDPGVVQLPPFEVTGGAHGSDVRTVGRRFFQYEYQMRLVAENLFGAEATVPPVQVSYRVETRAGQGEATQGRDLTYQLPALTVRVASLVPDSTRDIRETPGLPLREIDSVRLRASSLRLIGGVLMAVAGLLALAALVRLVRRGRASQTTATAVVPAREVLRSVQRTLSTVRTESQQTGWSPDMAGQALAALRVAAGYALDRPVAQRELVNGASRPDGQVIVAGRWPMRVDTGISGGATAETLSRALSNANGATNRLTLEELRDALAGLTAARYGRAEPPDLSALDEAIAGGIRATDRLAAEHTWIADSRRAVATWATTTASRMWKR
jgi:hypothetical protein